MATPPEEPLPTAPGFTSHSYADGYLTLNGTTGTAGQLVSLYDGYEWLGMATTAEDGAYSFTVAADPGRVHTYGVGDARLAWGGPASGLEPLDLTAPLPVFTGHSWADGMVTLEGSTGEAGSTVSFYDGWEWAGFATADAAGNFSFTVAADLAREHSFGINATDLAGNEGHGVAKIEFGGALGYEPWQDPAFS